jgi:hypothetical protein
MCVEQHRNYQQQRNKFIQRHEENISLERKAGILKNYQTIGVSGSVDMKTGFKVMNLLNARPVSANMRKLSQPKASAKNVAQSLERSEQKKPLA